MALYKQSTAYTRMFYMVLSSDHVAIATGITPTVVISKAGASFGAAGGSVSEVANGWYKIVLTTTDTNTTGDLAFYITGTSCDPVSFVDQIVAVDLLDATSFGVSRIDATISSRSTFSGGAVASVTAPVTVDTNNDKTGYSLTVTPPTAVQIRQEIDTNSTKLDVAVSTRSTYDGGPVTSVTGSVGSVTGSVGSVTGNIGGNVTGSVGSVVGNVGGSVNSVATDVGITQAGADKVWVSTTRTLTSGGTVSLTTGDKLEIIDGVLGKDLSTVIAPASRSLLQAARFIRNKWSIAGGVLTVTQENDSTTAWTAAVTTTAGAEPITTVDPA